VLADLGGHGGGLASHERYLSGLLLAIGLAFWTTLSDIEGKTARFRLLTALVVIGGISRLVGVAFGMMGRRSTNFCNTSASNGGDCVGFPTNGGRSRLVN
jgi:hypothetical protein